MRKAALSLPKPTAGGGARALGVQLPDAAHRLAEACSAPERCSVALDSQAPMLRMLCSLACVLIQAFFAEPVAYLSFLIPSRRPC